jgi:hypothetical protein
LFFISTSSIARLIFSLSQTLSMANGFMKLPRANMTSAPQIQPKFLPNRHDLGVVAVGFSGGQVRGALWKLDSCS